MTKLLFLAHRIPFPPNKGDKIRAFHVLKHLARTHDVFLGTLADDANETVHCQALSPFCRDIFCAPITRFGRLRRQILAGFSGSPLSVASFRHGALRNWVRRTLESVKPDVVYVSSSAMFEYVRKEQLNRARLIVDFVDVDAEKWRQYAAVRSPPVSWIFAEESRRLLHYDRAVAQAADACLFVSANERDLFARLAPEAGGKLHAVPNGVDAEYFSPAAFPSERPANPATIVFTGMMDYWPNIDAVDWFARAIFPDIRLRVPGAEFLIVGARPTTAVMSLMDIPGVRVTGAVADVRPYLARAGAVVAPLRVARGIQNKVLEGMSMARPVIATPEALEGISAHHGEHVLVAREQGALIDLTVATLLGGDFAGIGPRARSFVLTNHNWTANLRPLDQLINPERVHVAASPEVSADQG